MSDPDSVIWEIGTLDKPAIWAFYALTNFVGAILCCLLIHLVYKNPNRMSSDVFISGLASGCATMSISCGIECMLSFSAGRFYGGTPACQWEAIFHISSILTQFFCVASLSLGMYWNVVRNKPISIKKATCIVSTIWLSCIVVTCLTSLVSPIYLMRAGTFCFFGFSSLAIAGELVPGLIVSLIIMLYCHIKIIKHFTAMLPKVKLAQIHSSVQMISEQDIWVQQFKWRSTILMIELCLGWGASAITTIYEFVEGNASEALVTTVGVMGVSFSVWVPLSVLYTSPNYRDDVWAMLPSWCMSKCCTAKETDSRAKLARITQSLSTTPQLTRETLKSRKSSPAGRKGSSPMREEEEEETGIEIANAPLQLNCDRQEPISVITHKEFTE